MGNIIPSHSSPPLSQSNPFCHYLVPKSSYQVFICHRGKDTKETLASFVYDGLQNRGFKPFLDKKSIRVRQCIPEAITCALRVASVHVVILSPNFAESEWCLDDLHLIIESGTPIVPVFWRIRPSEVRMEKRNGVYVKAFIKHKQAGKFSTATLEKWKNALRRVSLIGGFINEGEQGEMVEKITACVSEYIEMAKRQGNAFGRAA